MLAHMDTAEHELIALLDSTADDLQRNASAPSADAHWATTGRSRDAG